MLRRPLNLTQQSARRERQQAPKQHVHQKPTIKLNEWLTGFKGHNTQGIKNYVMNFFISEGLFDVAKQFSEEANISMPNINEQEIRARYRIKQYIQDGHIDQGLDQLEKLCKKKRKINQELMAKCQQQNQIQMKEFIGKKQEHNHKNNQLDGKAKLGLLKEQVQDDSHMEQQCNQEEEQNSQKQLKLRVPQQNSDGQEQQKSSKCIKLQQQPQKQMQMKQRKASHSRSEDPSQELYHEIWHQSQNRQERNPYDIFAKGQNQQLLFQLKCLKVINLIRENRIKESIEVAKKELIPYTKGTVEKKSDTIKQETAKVQVNNLKKQNSTEKIKQQEYLQRIQRVMSLIAFLNHQDSPNYELTTPQYRMRVAGQLNNLLLGDQCQGQTLTALLKLCKWCQKRLQAHINFPKLNIAGNQVYAYTK